MKVAINEGGNVDEDGDTLERGHPCGQARIATRMDLCTLKITEERQKVVADRQRGGA